MRPPLIAEVSDRGWGGCARYAPEGPVPGYCQIKPQKIRVFPRSLVPSLPKDPRPIKLTGAPG
jgi:hypothetical protein